MLPAYAAVAILSGIALQEALAAARSASSEAQRWRWQAGVYTLALLQLIRLSYSPAALVPTAQDVATGHALVDQIRITPGEVFVPFHGYLPALAGKKTYAHAVPLADVVRGDAPDAGVMLARQLDGAFRAHRFDAVFFLEAPTAVSGYFPINEYYRADGPVVESVSRFWKGEVRYVPR